jgi:ribosomal protein S18 acetylase RimI-like enzyme
MDYPKTFDTEIKAFPVDQLGSQGKEAWQQLQDKGYEVRVGLTAEIASVISQLALEPAIKEYCPKDSSERFTDQAATEKWLSKGRAVFLLIKSKDQAVVGYGWAGPATSSRIEGGEATFAIRVAEAGQGLGLATPYSRLIIAGAAILYDAKNVWLEVWESNAAAAHIYHKIGAQDVTSEVLERPTASGSMVQDIRFYMTLPDQFLNP